MSKGILKRVLNRIKNEPFLFSIDKCDEEAIAGWVFDAKNPTRLLSLELKRGSVVVYRIEASMFRQDLLEEGIGSGCHGFHIPTIELLPDGGADKFDIYVDNVKLNTDVLHVTVDAPAQYTPTDTQDSQDTSTAADMFKVAVDLFSPGEIRGWVNVLNGLEHSPTVEVKLNNMMLASTIADEYRKDLADAGIKNGRAAYTLKYDLESLPTKDVKLELFVDGLLVDNLEQELTLHKENIITTKKLELEADLRDRAGNEIDLITQRIREKNLDDGLPAQSYAGICNILIEKLAEANVRIAKLESMLYKK
ncbi:MAG: hypothetical protein Alis3KO_25720 [Aliiglaciecola sp.]